MHGGVMNMQYGMMNSDTVVASGISEEHTYINNLVWTTHLVYLAYETFVD